MKPKAKTTKPKKDNPPKVKPAVSAAAIRKTLKNVVKKNQVASKTKRVRAAVPADITKETQKKTPASGSGVNSGAKRTRAPNDVQLQGTSESQKKRQKGEPLLEVPKLSKFPALSVFVVGSNEVGQLGLQANKLKGLKHVEIDGDAADGFTVSKVTRPVQLPFPTSVIDIAAGGMHSVCLTSDGEVYTFGCNDESALGRPTDDDESEGTPRLVSLPEHIIMISAGDSHTAALSDKGHVYLWGNFRNSKGAMGLTPDGLPSLKPQRILEGKVVVKICSGSEHLLCLTTEGDVYSLGCAESGQLGRVSSYSLESGGREGLKTLLNPQLVPAVLKDKKFDNVWAGAYTTFLHEKSQNKIYACGLNNYSQLGYQGSEKELVRTKLKYVKNFRDTTMIDGGQHHTMSLNQSGLVFVAGRREYGRLGLGTIEQDAVEPTIVPALQKQQCSQISCGEVVSFAINSNGTVYSWGMGDSSQLGHGNEEDVLTPTPIEGDFSSWRAVKVAAGAQHTLVLARHKD